MFKFLVFSKKLFLFRDTVWNRLVDRSIFRDMNRYISFTFIILAFLVSGNQLEGQSRRISLQATKYAKFQIPGRVKVEKGSPSGTVVDLIDTETDQKEKEVFVSASGKFDLELKYFKEYYILISKEGFYDKKIEVSTVIPREVWEKDSIFPPFPIVVTLYPKVPNASLSFEGKPIGKVSYSPVGSLDNFDSVVLIDDQAIVDEIKNAFESVDEKEFQKKMAEALDFEKKNELTAALTIYTEVSKIRPSDKFVKEKIKELNADLKSLAAEGKIQAEFDRMVVLGDENSGNQKYYEAIQYYKGALKIKTGDQPTLKKLSDTEKLYALVNDKNKQDADINKFMALGESNFSQTRYAEAITNFKSVLNIKPDHLLAKSRMDEAEKLLAAETNEKLRVDSEFKRLITLGVQSVSELKYQQAIGSFKNALEIKPGDATTVAQLSNAEALLAKVRLEDEKTKRDEEFNRLLALGDEFLTKDNYTEAINYFNEALKIKSDDLSAKAKISNAREKFQAAEAERIRINAEKEAAALKQQKYNALIEQADNRLALKNFTEALQFYKQAIAIDQFPVYPSDRIKEIQTILESLTAKKLLDEKAFATDNVYSDHLAKADQFYKQSIWTLARDNYLSALKIKPNDKYAIDQVILCDKMTDLGITNAKMQDYNQKIARADTEWKAKNYNSARFYYQAALDLMNWQSYPAEQLKLIDKKSNESLSQPDLQLFSDNLSKGNDAFNKKDYSIARFYYNKAMEINHTIEIDNRLKEIDAVLDGSESKKLETEFADLIKKGNEALKLNNLSIARFYFQKANNMKPNEKYPKEVLQEIESGIIK